MSHKRITKAGNSAALLLSKKMLDKIGIDIGDTVDISIVDRTLILRPLDEVERTQKIDAVTKSVFKRRKSAYERLAKGVE